MHLRTWPLDRPLDLRWTLIGGHGPLERPTTLFDGANAWRATRNVDGAASVHMAVQGGELIARAYGAGASLALDAVPRWVGLDDDPGVLAIEHPRLRAIARQHAGVRVGWGRTLTQVLMPIVLAQRVTHAEASRSYRGLVLALGEPAPGPASGLFVAPEAAGWRSLPWHAYRRFGVERGRAETIRRIADVAHRLDALPRAAPRTALAKLEGIRGIGRWTAAIAVARALGWSDAVPLNDFHLPSAVTWCLRGQARGTDEEMLELLSPYAGQRWRVIQLILAANVLPPKFGPRRQGGPAR